MVPPAKVKLVAGNSTVMLNLVQYCVVAKFKENHFLPKNNILP